MFVNLVDDVLGENFNFEVVFGMNCLEFKRDFVNYFFVVFE